MGFYIGTSPLKSAHVGAPTIYQQVEYIQNSGTQYINTGLLIKNQYRVVAKIRAISSDVSSGGRITGGYLGQSGSTYYRLYVGGPYNSKWSYGYLGYYSNGGLGTFNIGTDYTMEFSWLSNNGFLKVNGTTIWSNTSISYGTSLGGNVCLMAANENNGADFYVHAGLRVYYAKIYNSSGNLVRDLVPYYRVADGAIGMYDSVTSTFYTNAGTGTFIKGPDV